MNSVDDNGDEIKTNATTDLFEIIITNESGISLDGGCSFENTSNIFCLDIVEAKILMLELQSYINGNN